MRDRHDEFGSVFAAYLAGATVVCHMVQSYYPPLQGLMRGLQKHHGFGWTANMYLSPRESAGFTVHTDNTDGFVVQLAGIKQWSVYNTTFLRHQTSHPASDPLIVPHCLPKAAPAAAGWSALGGPGGSSPRPFTLPRAAPHRESYAPPAGVPACRHGRGRGPLDASHALRDQGARPTQIPHTTQGDLSHVSAGG